MVSDRVFVIAQAAMRLSKSPVNCSADRKNSVPLAALDHSDGVGEVAGCKFADYPNVCAWLARMKSLRSWKKAHEAIEGYAATLNDQQFTVV